MVNVRRSADKLMNDLLRKIPFARFGSSYPKIADLGIIGDRHTAAVVTPDGAIVWYCPGRFDAPSLLGGLLDPAVAGSWYLDLPGAEPKHRRYLDDSAVLETTLHHAKGPLSITDWMNLPREECRRECSAARSPPRPPSWGSCSRLARITASRFHGCGGPPLIVS